MSPVPDVPPTDINTPFVPVSREQLAQIAADRWVTDGGSLLPPPDEHDSDTQASGHDRAR